MIDSRRHSVRSLGPTAWAVLEVLYEHGVAKDDGGLVAEVSVRSLAAECGLAKNTVQRALRRLRALGLIEARQNRTSTGTFSAGHYALTNTGPTERHSHVPIAPSPPVLEIRPNTPTPSPSAPSTQLTLDL